MWHARSMLSKALASSDTQPVYNFLGSFNRTDHTRMLPVPQARSQLAATLIARAAPWITW